MSSHEVVLQSTERDFACGAVGHFRSKHGAGAVLGAEGSRDAWCGSKMGRNGCGGKTFGAIWVSFPFFLSCWMWLGWRGSDLRMFSRVSQCSFHLLVEANILCIDLEFLMQVFWKAR